MGIRKTDRDIARERIARAMTGKLVGTDIGVTGGGSEGPYQVVVSRLSRAKAQKVVEALRRILEVRP